MFHFLKILGGFSAVMIFPFGKKMYYILPLYFFSFVSATNVPEFRSNVVDELYTLMSTMTPYDRVRGKIPEFEDCRPEAMWAFIRHGTRYPHKEDIERFSNITGFRNVILENHKQSRGELSQQELIALQTWSLTVDVNQEMLLSTSGVDELRSFGERLGKSFPNLLRNYSPSTVNVRITSLERTRQSASAFLTGLYKYSMKIPNSLVYNELLKNEWNCSAWELSTQNNDLKEQQAVLRKSPEMRDLITNVSKRLGFDYDLSFDQIKEIYDVCTYEYAWYHNKNDTPWCAAFTENQLKIMEFSEDLTYYFKSAYGNPYVPKLGCALVSDMIDKLTNTETLKSTLYFGHSLSMRKLLVSLGIGQDTLISGDSYPSSSDRKWRTSYLTPFAANMIAARYSCKKGSHGIKDTSRLAIFVNEKLTALPACGGRLMCGLSEFFEKFGWLTHPGYCNRNFCNDVPNKPFNPKTNKLKNNASRMTHGS